MIFHQPYDRKIWIEINLAKIHQAKLTSSSSNSMGNPNLHIFFAMNVFIICHFCVSAEGINLDARHDENKLEEDTKIQLPKRSNQRMK